MARQLPSDTYAQVLRKRVALIWHTCRICRVSFKWEPFFLISIERDLRFPSDEERNKGIIRFFPYPDQQTVCVHCAKQFGLDRASITPITNEEFDALIDKMHAGTQPLPVHDSTMKKMTMVSRDSIK
jgi:hypothetical protein